ncbi:MAG: TIGR03960 family B12-binding radical SAM protein [Lachnospiraceae bacterium]|nr:TIGR03960 family B12-binding radical SAM protein [Lachnospiraceae bacterium]
MRKLFLNDHILRSVEKPARYIGGEMNSVYKDPEDISVRFCMCFPDVYEIGMSHLGIQIIYDQLNRRSDTWCERVYSPWPDLHSIMKERDIPLFALESQEELRKFDFLGFTLQYELCYTNVLQILDLSHFPFFAKDRDESYPLVVGGGPCTYNPEPLADFFDLFYIGDSEKSLDSLVDLYRDMKADGYDKTSFLRAAAKLPGIYVPFLYQVAYNEDGSIHSFRPVYDDVPSKVKKQVCMDFTNAPYPERPVIPYLKATQDRITLEVMRGCIRGCRFCQAGMLYRPLRQKSVEQLKKEADIMITGSGHEEISLSSLSSSDFTDLPELLDYLIKNFRAKSVNITLPSLRIDNFSLDVMSRLQDVRKSSLTFAPEAGTQRLRDVINKGLTKEDILSGSGMAFRGGWNKVKLYFMLGLPTECDDDRKGIAHLAQAVADNYYEIPKDKRNGKCEITVSTSFFVPKPFTPFQWAPMFHAEDYIGFARTVKSEIRSMKNQRSIHYNWHDAEGTVLEGVFARGDRRLAAAIVHAYEHGAMYDAWTDFFDMGKWQEAFTAAGLDIDFYNLRERDTSETLPWDFIDIGVTKEFMIREWELSKKEQVTPNCRQKCSGCGARAYGGGVCFESREKITDVGI